MANQYQPLEERFWLKVDRSAGLLACWKWTGTIGSAGYGRIRHNKVQRQASRVAYEIFHGQVPSGLTLDHLCRNRWCVNPLHLEAVKSGENIRRGISPSAINRRKTKCPSGHSYTNENTRISKTGKRHCRICERIRWHRRKIQESK